MCGNMPAGTYCSDGTPANTCLPNQAPKYCNNVGAIEDNCGQCGCSNGWVCGPTGTFCCDNECNGTCAVAGCTAAEDPDCGGAGCCGDNACNAGECSSCPADCTLADCCGNGSCDSAMGENSANCFADCHNCANSGENNYYVTGQGDCNQCDHPGDDDGDQSGWNAAVADQCDSDCGSVLATVQPGDYEAVESSCADNIDNDCDGQTDCADSDCASDPACACIPDGCNGTCPANCGGADDPDCPGACLDCTCSTDSDCPATCAAGDGCCASCSPADPDCGGGAGNCTFPANLPCTFP